MTIGIGLLGLGTVGAGVAAILATPQGRHPLVADLELKRVAVRDLARPRPVARKARQSSGAGPAQGQAEIRCLVSRVRQRFAALRAGSGRGSLQSCLVRCNQDQAEISSIHRRLLSCRCLPHRRRRCCCLQQRHHECTVGL